MTKRVFFVRPSTAHVDRLRAHVRTVLEACGCPGAFVTDRSLVGHFVAYREALARRAGAGEAEVAALVALQESLISARLGLEVTCSTPVWHAAEALADRARETPTEE